MLDNILASSMHISISSLLIFCIAVNIGKAPASIKSKIPKRITRDVGNVQYTELYKIYISPLLYCSREE